MKTWCSAEPAVAISDKADDYPNARCRFRASAGRLAKVDEEERTERQQEREILNGTEAASARRPQPPEGSQVSSMLTLDKRKRKTA